MNTSPRRTDKETHSICIALCSQLTMTIRTSNDGLVIDVLLRCGQYTADRTNNMKQQLHKTLANKTKGLTVKYNQPLDGVIRLVLVHNINQNIHNNNFRRSNQHKNQIINTVEENQLCTRTSGLSKVR